MGYAKTPDDFSRRVIEELFNAMPDVSLREIGRRAELDHSLLSRIKRGERILDVDQLDALASVAGIAPHIIVERAEKRGGGAQLYDFPAPMPPTDDELDWVADSNTSADEEVEKAQELP